MTTFNKDTDLAQIWKQLLLAHAKNVLSADNYEMLSWDSDFLGVQPFPADPLLDIEYGEVASMYEQSLAITDKAGRKKAGRYFTPDDISQKLASYAFKDEFNEDKVWLDPCTGIGNLVYWLTLASKKEAQDFLSKQVVLSDIDPLALFIAQTMLALRLDPDNAVETRNMLKSRSYEHDFLSDEPLPSAYDYIIMNPPYARSTLEGFETSSSQDLYAFFLERAAKTTEGFIAITPQSYTNGGKFKTLREVLIRELNQVKLLCFDNVPAAIFKGTKYGSDNTNTSNSTRACILVAHSKKTVGINSDSLWEITPMLRWRATERSHMLDTVDSFLSPFTPRIESFPKHFKSLTSLYGRLTPETRLQDLVSATGEHILYVPASPRYFITAAVRGLNRASLVELRFNTKKDLNTAYLLINSSLMYYWWRLHGGGMTLTKDNILSLPVPADAHFDSTSYEDKKLVKMLLLGEQNSMVSKKNAGMMSENIKHSPDVIHALNERLFKDEDGVVSAMEFTHRNTYFADTP